MSRVRRWLSRLATLAILLGLGWAGAYVLGRSKPTSEIAATPPEKPPVAVTVEPVATREVQRTVTVVGSLFGRDEVAITPKVEGRVVAIRQDVGDVVRPGDVLLQIDPTDYKLAEAEAGKALELELAKLGLRELPRDRLDVSALPSVSKAAAMERNATARRDRLTRLGPGGGTTAEERDLAQTEFEVAQANHRLAVLDAESTLAAARHRQAIVETLRQKIADATVVVPGAVPTAPPSARSVGGAAVGGQDTSVPEYVVTYRGVSAGEIVRSMPGDNTVLFRLVVDRPLKFQAAVPDRHRGEVALGQAAELEVEAYPGERFRGEVARVNPSVDRTNRTFQVEVHVPNADRRLSAGSFARASILTKVDTAARTVPEEAIVRYAGVTKVFIVQDDTAREVSIRTGISGVDRNRTWVEVAGDLPADARVVTSGQSQLGNGTRVRVR